MKVLILVLLISLMGDMVHGFPSTAVLDNFNRADQEPVTGWTDDLFGNSSDCKLTSNTLREGTSGDGSCYWTSAFSGGDQEGYITLPNADSHTAGGAVRFIVCGLSVGSANVDGYALEFVKDAGTDFLRLRELTNGAYTTMGSTVNQEVTNGDSLGIEAFSDGTVNAWFKDGASAWTLLFTRTDASPLNCDSSRIGVAMTSSQHHWDDAGGGPIAASGGNATGHIILQAR